MPFVRILHVKDALTADQKRRMLAGVTDAVAAVEGERMRVGIGVAIDESIASRDLVAGALPWVTVTLIKDALTAEQRGRLLSGVTEAIVAVQGEATRPAVWVVIEESVGNGEWGIGGQRLTFDAMDRIRRGENPWPASGAA